MPAGVFDANVEDIVLDLSTNLSNVYNLPLSIGEGSDSFVQVSPGVFQSKVGGKYLANVTSGLFIAPVASGHLVDYTVQLVQNAIGLKIIDSTIFTESLASQAVNLALNAIINVKPLDLITIPLTVVRDNVVVNAIAANLHLIMTPI